MKCLGCGIYLMPDEEIHGILALTCRCDATFFITDDGKPMPPVSFIRFIAEGREPPHIDYYLGKSNFWNPQKEEIFQVLKNHGAVWSWECPKCKDRVIERLRAEKKEGFILYELHPDLAKLVG